MHVFLNVIFNVYLCFILMTTETNEERIVSKFILFIMAPRKYLAAVKQVHETAYSSLYHYYLQGLGIVTCSNSEILLRS
jgi:hypothetical protein